MPAIAPAIPTLPTFNQPASWHNRAGRVDRSACLELRASEVRSCAHLRARRSSTGLEAAGPFTATARYLFQLHRKRLPQQLAGDHRTTKSNAMRPRKGPAAKTRPNAPHIRIHQPGEAHNPNKGATRTKMLGLYAAGNAPGMEEDWKQTIRIERHRLHERLAQHFLICPICGNKYVKLFMVLCTEDEVRDAELAEGWIKILEGRFKAARKPIPAHLLATRANFLNRYGLIFRARRLACRKCLHIRYGEKRKPRRSQVV